MTFDRAPRRVRGDVCEAASSGAVRIARSAASLRRDTMRSLDPSWKDPYNPSRACAFRDHLPTSRSPQRVMQIVSYPHPALRWKSKPIVRIDADLKQMVRAMFDLMYATNGIGLAANQVAMPLRLFIMNATGSAAESAAEHVFINPEIVRRKGSAEGEEGCLSLPG